MGDSAPPARVVVADDHQLSRAGLIHVFAREPSFTVIGEAENGRRLVDLVERLRPDLALVDVRMPEMDGITAVEHIRALGLPVAVVMVTAAEDGETLLRALRAGASGYVLKDVARDDLLTVATRALRGEVTIEPGLAATLLQRLAAGGDERRRAPDPLTRREVEILRLVAQGRTNREIASRLIVAVGTVKAHVEHILAKLGVADRTQAAVRAVELGLITGDDGLAM